MCAIWNPKVYLNDKNKMMNLKKEIPRCSKIICEYCSLLGAGLGCVIKECKNSYHYKCALEGTREKI